MTSSSSLVESSEGNTDRSTNTNVSLEASQSVETVKVNPQVHPDCPYLYKIPEGLHRYYQPLSVPVQAITLLVAAWVAAVSTWTRLAWWQPLSILRGFHSAPSPVKLASFAMNVMTYFLLTHMVLQEVIARPSRISTETLLQKYFLPSKFSKYRTIDIPGMDEDEAPFSLGVHFLEYQHAHVKNTTNEHRFDALYLQHGFGASSLSWLPVIPSLVHRLNARVGLAHDAVGFGFTDRPSNQKWYTSKQSARIAHQVMRHQQQSDAEAGKRKAVALMGHSMGSLAMLRLATQLPAETFKFIILCSPALGINNRKVPPQKRDRLSWIRRNVVSPVGRKAQQTVLVPVAKYLLRRIIGTNGSWKTGLKAAWGDPAKVTDGDVLRFSWPAIGLGWEEGILRFASAQAMQQEDELDNDNTLMQRVLELPNTKVAIILGSRDRVVTSNQVRRFMKVADPNGKVKMIELDGLGHDAFEEDEQTFCRTVDELLASVGGQH
ncbi:serine aminopeptidase, S33 [Nitzschia inconspicua]|uniref:Serine aminopeptidase, S33 n=1 Tax=Nitzschia inconspicua TaxID=303405 RepID=A0A9K3L167_9STRA|nr:serine aminopeptidase, S33 [Nitzschia inconspicua]